MRPLFLALALALPLPATAQDSAAILTDVVDAHVLPGYARLSETTGTLASAAQAGCDPVSPDLQAAFYDAFDDWILVSHLRFGPSERDDRAFALAFWPDTKGFTPKALSGLISTSDPVVENPKAFAETSIAGRGFFALEMMLFDPAFADQGQAPYRCALIRAITTDIDRNAKAIAEDWQPFAEHVTQPGGDSPYRSENEALQELYKALSTGLQFTSETRLGRPLGTFDRPRPKRAEARRSARSVRHVELSLITLRDLAMRLSADHPAIAADMDGAFDNAIARAQALNDPAFAGVANPLGRLRIEALQQSINDVRQIAANDLGPTLGISAGFNALDGD
ncbi:imelysin family protein [Ruegeria lacuscaerulensis]|uniref:imelysin family protein n=1 Tax=Ruegeria lacuscaerulensis TaxID=55218 RepID=UPI00147BB68E|nr:imelysin family protein [Ruegeria lacuscaerulensis]